MACKPHNFAVKMERGNETSAESAACTERARGRTRVLGAACRTGPQCRSLSYPEDTGRARSVPALSPATSEGSPCNGRCRTLLSRNGSQSRSPGAWVGPVSARLLPDQRPDCSHPPGTNSPQTAGWLRVREAPSCMARRNPRLPSLHMEGSGRRSRSPRRL